MGLFIASLYLEFLGGAVALLGLLYLYSIWTFDYWKKKGVPYVKPVPLFGNVLGMVMGRVFEGVLFKKIYDDYNGQKFVGAFFFRDPTLVVRDPDIIKDALIHNFASFHDRGLPADEVRDPLSAHLFNLPGPRWRALRAKLTPTFTSGKMKMMYQLMEECSVELCRGLKDPAITGEELEMRETMAKFTTDIIGSCAFGLQMNSMKDSDSEFRSMGRKVFEPSLAVAVRRLIINFLYPVARFLKLTFAGSEVDHFFLNAVKETIKYREDNNVMRNDFIQLLIQLRNQDRLENNRHNLSNGTPATQKKLDINMTDNLLAAQVFVFFLAGFETSSTLMSFALYELALHPEIQTQLREEIDSVLQKTGGKLSYEILQEMEYMDKVVSETLRKYPPVSNLIRQCTKPYTIPGTNIKLEEGTRLLIPGFGIHYDPAYYPDPQRFDPERFNAEEKSKRHHFTYLPFGEGPRNCIGMRFGLLQAKLGLASLLREFQFSPSKHTVVPIRCEPNSIVTASKDGIHLKISLRDKCSVSK